MDVQREDIQELLEIFSKVTYNAWDQEPKVPLDERVRPPEVQQVMQRCLDLFGLDYTYSVVSNNSGELSTNYPSSLIILKTEKNHEDTELAAVNSTINLSDSKENKPSTNGNRDVEALLECTLNGDSNGDSQTISSTGGAEDIPDPSIPSTFDDFIPTEDIANIKEMCTKARYARCRARFPVPVVLYKNKHICRSATLSGGPEIYGRTSFDYFFASSSSTSKDPPATATATNVNNSAPSKTSGTAPTKIVETETTDEEVIVPVPVSEPDAQGPGEWLLFDRVRRQDIQLLKSFQVHTIVDLMVEKKKVKYGVYVTSSEKVDKKNRYSEFNLISLPYPGCEFFKQYRDNGYNGEELVFEWNQGHVDANIYVPSDQVTDLLNLDWSQYRKWDLVRLTQNYMKLILAYLRNETSGLLIHCISGWDRTPLFLSLIRLSLWADGAIHKSLNAEQILYLTLAYDWLLFGHNLVDRLNKGEEILFFCFYFLIHIVSDDFSMDFVQPKYGSDKTANSPRKVSENSGSTLKGCSGNGTGTQCTHSGPHECHEMSTLERTSEFNGTTHTFATTNGSSHDESKLPPSASNGFGDESHSISASNSHDHSIQNGSVTSLPEETATTNGGPVHSVVNAISGEHGENHLEATSCSSISNPNSTYSSDSKVEQAEEANACSVYSNAADSVVSNSSSKSSVSVGRINSDTLMKMNGNEPAVEDSSSAPLNSSTVSSLPTSHSNGSGPAEPTKTTLETLETTTSSSSEGRAKQEDTESERLKDGSSSKDEDPELNFKSSHKNLNGSSRCERLQIVRALFYSTYKSLLTNPHGVNENSSGNSGGSGLSVMLDNLATKVGLKTANRISSI